MHEQILELIIAQCLKWDREGDPAGVIFVKLRYSYEQLADAVVQLATKLAELRAENERLRETAWARLEKIRETK